MEAPLNTAIGYQALHLPHPQDALRHARQQVTKAWAQHGGWPTSFPKEAMMAHWRYYGDNTGALVEMAYVKHAAHLLHRPTHNHQPEVREAAAIRIKEATNGLQHLPPVDTGAARCLHLRGHWHLGPATTHPTASHACHPDKPPLRSTGATRGHAHRHPLTPGRRGGHPAPREGPPSP